MEDIIEEILETLEQDKYGSLEVGEIKNSLAIAFLNCLGQAHNEDMLSKEKSNVLGETIQELVERLLNVKQ